MVAALIAVVAVVVILILLISASVKIAREYERGVVFRLGRLLQPPRGTGALLPHPDHRQDGPGRSAHGDTERAAAGSDHEGQRPGSRQRRGLLPHRRAHRRDRPGRELHERDVTDLADDPAQRPRPASARRAARRAGQDQRDSPADHRRVDVAVGDQGLRRRDEGRRDTDRHAARHGAPGRGRARAARQGDRRRGRVPGLRAAQGRRECDQRQPDRAPAPLPPDDDRDECRADDDDDPAAAARAVHGHSYGRETARAKS